MSYELAQDNEESLAMKIITYSTFSTLSSCQQSHLNTRKFLKQRKISSECVTMITINDSLEEIEVNIRSIYASCFFDLGEPINGLAKRSNLKD
ncbi:hypothetical protein K7X08_002869 [Anisodus acutangulus]|uniref:Uncharacterized protein n=1 Tax=Anisodus acutangulus TaxID=402998 RepID=A0A9Q1MGD6_9SOLA|nr:hypothetical protein K7X08_002869 [Anisodus acutangulus]